MASLLRLLRKYVLPLGAVLLTLCAVLAFRRNTAPKSHYESKPDDAKGLAVENQALKADDVNSEIAEVNATKPVTRKVDTSKSCEDLIDEYNNM